MKHTVTNPFPDILKTAGILFLGTSIGFLFIHLGFTEANIITVYILGVLVTALVTKYMLCSLLSSVISVLLFNFFFISPYFTFKAAASGYPVTFLIMLLAAFITGSLTAKLKRYAHQAAQAAARTQILLDTNQLLQKAEDTEEILSAAAGQISRLFQKTVHLCPTDEQGIPVSPLPQEEAYAPWLSFSVKANGRTYAIIHILMENSSFDEQEKEILSSILGDCALVLENRQNAHEKEEAAVLAKNEQLRANLLRAISHDLRTPLTSISGNANNLLYNEKEFNEEEKKQIYTDIYEDSMWLISIVENVLSVTRIEEGRMNLHLSAELMDEVITEALSHLSPGRTEHEIRVESTEDFLLAKMDGKLMVQVLINLVDNAIKYTPPGSAITIFTTKKDQKAVVKVMDNGPGISDEGKKHVFDMFYSGAGKIADSRRSLGLGLSLCKSIINAHGGEITVENNSPHGTVFTFTLPAEEVNLHE